MTDSIRSYINAVQREFASGVAAEHAYRPALKVLLETIAEGVHAVNDPKRQKCGAPDFVVSRTKRREPIDIGYIEAKDIDVDLNKVEKSDQVKRYLASIGENFILTDYLEFRFFRDGEKVETVRIGEIGENKIKPLPTKFDTLNRLLIEFAEFRGQTIKSAKDLAFRMAHKAQLMREVFFNVVSDKETPSGLHDQLGAFRHILIHDMDEAQFSDVYAQTIAYGLFTARLHDETLEDFSRQEARDLIPRSNPFLRRLFDYVCGADLDQRVVWIVDALCEVYRATDLHDILKDFGESTGRNDPIVHFYETFLGEYDRKLRKSRGVYYTPEPVVNFIVRAIDHVLNAHFNLPDGLADTSKVSIEVDDQAFEPTRRKGQSGGKRVAKKKIDVHRVQMLDVATGTGSFIAEVIKQIHAKFGGQEGMWSRYVEEDLLPRLHGFEILMAPYAMCHLKIEMLLNELGYRPSKPQNPPRVGVYLTNALEEHHPDADTLFASWLAREANEASRVKRDMPIMVAFGNPPYSVSSQNKGEWIQELIAEYKAGLNEKKLNLDDDYIKFIRYAEHYIERIGYGVVAMITNNSFLDGVTHRRMRKHLLETFDHIYVVDLHGNSMKHERSPDGSPDENVFDITIGVGISVFVKDNSNANGLANVYSVDFFGDRASKYERLFESSIAIAKRRQVTCNAPYFFFVPKDFSEETRYEKGFSTADAFPEANSGIQTKRDKLVYQFSSEEIRDTLATFRQLSVDEARLHFGLPKDGRDWSVRDAQSDLLNETGEICEVHYKPFDIRWTYYSGRTKGFMAYPRSPLMAQCRNENISFLFVRNSRRGNVNNYFVTKNIVDKDAISPFDNVRFSPLYLYDVVDNTRTPNLNKRIVSEITENIGLRFVPEHEDKAEGDLTCFSPLDFFDYVYAVLHSPNYRETYKEFLKIDFPRIPYPESAEMFWRLAALGGEIRKFHLMEHEESGALLTTFPVDGDCVVEKIGKDSFRPIGDGAGKVFINETQYFDGVPERAWRFYIGGYQPAQKWLKDRKGRALSAGDIRWWQKIIVALLNTDRLMKAIDEAWRPSL